MDLLLPYMEQQRSPMAQYMYEKLVIPLLNGNEPSVELPRAYATLMEHAQRDRSFQYSIFGANKPAFLAELSFDNPAIYAVVRSFSFSGTWTFSFQEVQLPPEWFSRKVVLTQYDKDHIIRLFFSAAVGAPETLLKGKLDLNAKALWWARFSKIDEASFFLRGSMKERYGDYKAIFLGMCQLMQTYLESDSFLTVLSILCLCSTFNIYNKINWLNLEFQHMQEYVANLNIDFDERKLVTSRDPKYIDQVVLQILRDKLGRKYQSVINRLEFSSMFSETVESLLSESLL